MFVALVLACPGGPPRPPPPLPTAAEPAQPLPSVQVQHGPVKAASLRFVLPHTTWLGEVAWAPDGAYLATGDDEGVVRIWDTRTGQPVRELARHERRISALAYAANGERLAVAGLTDLRVWDTRSGALLHRLPGHADIIGDLRFVGEELHAVDLRNALRRWDVASGRELAVLEVPTIHSLSVAIAPGATALALGGYGELLLLDLPGRSSRFKLSMPRCDQHPDDLLCARWKSRRYEEFGHEGGDPSTYKQDSPQWYVQDLAFSGDGRLLLAGRADGVAILVDAAAGTPLARFVIGDDDAAAVALTPDGATAALANRDGVLALWDVAARRELPVTHEPGLLIAGLAFSPDATALAAAGPGQVVTIWDLAR